MVNVPKILNTFLFMFSNKMFVFRAGIHKTVRIGNRVDPDWAASQKQSDLSLHCLPRLIFQATSVRNFRTLTKHCTF